MEGLDIWLNTPEIGHTVARTRGSMVTGEAQLSEHDQDDPLIGAVVAGLRALLQAWDPLEPSTPDSAVCFGRPNGRLEIDNAEKWIRGVAYHIGRRIGANMAESDIPLHFSALFEEWAQLIVLDGDATLILNHARF